MKERSKLVNVKVEQIYPHPDNPRKNVGDIAELTESVRKNGIMQNLTIIPISSLDEPVEKQVDAEDISLLSDFHVLIGHRRLAAAMAAGFKEVPCRIVSQISKKEQVSIMLEENMQRNDLTIYEQAQGFQMMLDLGETAETIAEKTGFSKATVYHRLNLAKLDPKELKEKEDNEGFQMSLKDLYELEKVSDVETRNRLLKEARNSSDLAFRAQQAAKEEKRKKTMEQLIVMLEEKGIKPAPKKAENEQWNGKWDKLKQYDLEKELPEEIKVQARKTDELFYIRWYNQLHIIREFKKNNKVSKEEQARKEKEKRKKDLKSKTKQLIKKAKDYIKCIVEGKITPIKETEALRKQILNVAVLNGLSMYHSTIANYFTGKTLYQCTDEEIKTADKAYDKLSFINQLLVALSCSISNDTELYDYFGKFKPEVAKELIAVFDLLELYGWIFEDDEKQLLDGTHELYMKEEE